MKQLLAMGIALAAVMLLSLLRELAHEWRRRLHVANESEER